MPTIRDVVAPVNETELFVMVAMMEHPEAVPGGAADFRGNRTAQAVSLPRHTTSFRTRAIRCTSSRRDEADQQQGSEDLWRPRWRGQHFFGESGFGVQANYTIVRGDVAFNDNARSEREPVRAVRPERFGQRGRDVREVRAVGATRIQLARRVSRADQPW